MATCQLNVRVERALAARLRREATRRRQTPGVLVAEAIEALLAGAKPEAHQPLAADSSALAAQLAALTERVALLEQQARPAPAPKAPAQPITIEAPAGAITTAELVERTGTNAGGWNNWARTVAPGEVRHHPQAGSWRLIGKVPAPGGGPARWLWEPAQG